MSREHMFGMYAEALQSFCNENGLDFDKVKSSPFSANSEFLVIQHLSDRTISEGLNNETPAEVVLAAYRKPDGTITVETRKNTDKYLGR